MSGLQQNRQSGRLVSLNAQLRLSLYLNVMAGGATIEVNGLSKRYAGSKSYALNNLNIEVAQGEIYGFLGPNGAGKTTTIRLILGLIKPSSGHVKIFGLDSEAEKIAVHKRLAYVPAEAMLWPSLTGAETLHLLGRIHGQTDQKYLKVLMDRFQFEPNKKVRSYSKGNRQKVNLIAALASRAELLIMDEPTAGLDPIMERAFRESAQEAKDRGQTIFLSSHILSEVEALCDKLAILRGGRLVESGTLAQMRHLSAVTVEAVFEGEPPKLTGIAGVKNVVVNGHQLNCQIQGDISPLLTELAKAKPTTLLSREPSLEELFLSLYVKEK